MAAHEAWGARAELVQFSQYGKYYKGRVKFTLYDYVGLTVSDIGADVHMGHNQPSCLRSGLCSWFVLQHEARFAYQPFISMMEFHYQIEGNME